MYNQSPSAMILKNKSAIFLIGYIFLSLNVASAQNQKVADSLSMVYKAGKTKGVAQLELLRNLAFNEESDHKLSLRYSEELIKLAQETDNYTYLHRGQLQKGNTFLLLGNLEEALAAFFKSAEAAIIAEYKDGEAGATMAIADTYSEIGNTTNANLYYSKAIALFRETDNAIFLATALLNAGDEAFNNKRYDVALNYFEESGQLFKESEYLIGTAYNLGNIGMVYAEQGNHELAFTNINEAIATLEDLQDYYAISEYLTYMSDIYLEQNDRETALFYANRSLDLARKYGLKKQISESNLKLSNLYELAGNYEKTHFFFKNYVHYRDSVANLEKVQQIADYRTNFEVSKKQTEVDLLEKDAEIQSLKDRRQRTIIYCTIALLLLIVVLSIALYRRYLFIQRTKRIIEKEKNVSDNLLLNILPARTADELKKYGKVRAEKFNSVTVLFTDFEDFTHYAENLSPEVLVKTIDFYFSKFDAIMEDYGLEKIKTIGDAYMCAGGLQSTDEDHALKMVRAALEITQFVDEVKQHNTWDLTPFDIRVGINTGPVVAGVVGVKKFAYDIWGDTVNIASRMESNSTPGKINISEATYALIKDTYHCEYRGEITAKNKGKLKMYFVNEHSKDLKRAL
jgi:adenylate cyclase